MRFTLYQASMTFLEIEQGWHSLAWMRTTGTSGAKTSSSSFVEEGLSV